MLRASWTLSFVGSFWGLPVKQVYTERYSCLTPYRSDARGVAALVIGLNTKTESTAARHAPGATDQEEECKYAVA